MIETEDLKEVVRLLDDAAAAGSRFDVETLLRSSLPSLHAFGAGESPGESPARGAAAHALGYRLKEVRNGGRRKMAFEPYFRASSGEQHPPGLESTGPETVAIWAALADRVTATYARARLHHLLFAVRHGRPHEHAEAAVRAYLDAAAGWRRDIDAVDDIKAALYVARSVGRGDLAAEAMTAMTEAAEEAVDSADPVPGVTVMLLEALVEERDAPAAVDTLLERAWEAYTDPWIRDRLARVRLRRASTASEREASEAASVQLWLDAADAAEGMLRAAHLQTALERATETGRKELIERAAAALQTVVPEQLGLQAISAHMAIPDQQVADLLEPITGAPSWPDALTVFGGFGPVTRDIETNRQQVAEQAQLAPLSQLLPRQILGGDGLPRFRAETDAQKQEMNLAELEVHLLRFWAPLLAEALVGIARKHGIPAEQELAALLAERQLIDDSLAGALARILTRFWTGDFEGAAFTAAPRLEALTRKLVLATGAGVYRLQRKNNPGQYPGLGALLSVLKDQGLNESWYRFLYTLAANPAGWNLRNEISHGFVDDVHAPVAALLIQALLYLSGLTATPAGEPDDNQAAGAEPAADRAADSTSTAGSSEPSNAPAESGHPGDPARPLP